MNVGLLDGELAWRQHDGGHTDEPNLEHFIRWVDRLYAARDGQPPRETDAVPSGRQAVE